MGSGRARARPALRSGRGDRRGRGRHRARPVGRARERRDAARRARAARAPLQRPPAADVHALARPRAARRRLGGGHRRDGEAVEQGTQLAELLGLRPFELADSARTLYHAGAVFASNYVVALQRAASLLFESAGAPPEALEPLMRRTIENGFELTGPDLARRLGDGRRRTAPRSTTRGRSSTTSTRRSPARRWRSRHEDRADDRRAARRARGRGRPRADDGRAARRPPRRSSRAARRENELVVASLFVNPAQFGEAADLAAYPRDEERGRAHRRGVRRRHPLRAERGRAVSRRLRAPGSTSRTTGAEGAARPGHFRGVATVCLKLFNIVRPARAYFGQKDAQQALVIRRMVRDLNLGLEVRVLPTVRDDDGLALSSRNVRLSPDGARGCARPPSSSRTTAQRRTTTAATQSPPPAVP